MLCGISLEYFSHFIGSFSYWKSKSLVREIYYENKIPQDSWAKVLPAKYSYKLEIVSIYNSHMKSSTFLVYSQRLVIFLSGKCAYCHKLPLKYCTCEILGWNKKYKVSKLVAIELFSSSFVQCFSAWTEQVSLIYYGRGSVEIGSPFRTQWRIRK